MKRFMRSFVAIAAVTSALGPQLAKAATNAKFAVSTLRLPNGEVLATQNGSIQGVKWKDVQVYLWTYGVPPQHFYGESVVGNHSQILNQEFISTPFGRVWFALNKRTPPAASGSSKATYEYWAAIERNSPKTGYHIDYCIEAVVVGNRAKAETETKELISDWAVPSSADAVAYKLPFSLMTPNTNLFPFKVATVNRQIYALNPNQALVHVTYQNATKTDWIIEDATNGDSRLSIQGVVRKVKLKSGIEAQYVNNGLQQIQFTRNGVYYSILAGKGTFKGLAKTETRTYKPLTTENGLLSIVNSMDVHDK